MIIKSYAKINLGLDVVKKRSDGYHDVKMIMQTIDLFDTLEVSLGLKNGENVLSVGSYGEMNLVCSDENVPCDETNLVFKAALEFLNHTKKCADIFIKIEKNIPVGAGLAGGSSNAAATLEALNLILKTNLSNNELMKLAANIGADVPFCIAKNTYLAEGIGEILTPVKNDLKFKILLVKPPFSVSTLYVYKNLLLDKNTYHPDIEAVKNAILSKNVLEIYKNLGNTLESVTLKMHPEIAKIKKDMCDLGARVSLMSGSGPSVFGIFDNENNLENAYKIMKEKYKQTYLTSTLNNV